jgi:hypothetical protein
VLDEDRRLPLDRVRRDLARSGILPFTDPKARSLVSIVAGAPVAGSWWGHPAGQWIYSVGEALDSDPDVVVVKLWHGKLTLIHRRLWPALVRIGQSRTAWQTTGLSKVSRLLLAHIELEGTIRADRLPPGFRAGSSGFRIALRELESRLLVLARSVHTTTGAHALEAQSWSSWSALVGVPRFSGSIEAAQSAIERAARRLTPGIDPSPMFPWGRARTRAASQRLPLAIRPRTRTRSR